MEPMFLVDVARFIGNLGLFLIYYLGCYLLFFCSPSSIFSHSVAVTTKMYQRNWKDSDEERYEYFKN